MSIGSSSAPAPAENPLSFGGDVPQPLGTEKLPTKAQIDAKLKEFEDQIAKKAEEVAKKAEFDATLNLRMMP